MNHERFQSIVKSIYVAVNELEKMFPGRPFTPDGHLVGSLGECLVADAYNLTLMPPSTKGYDAITKEGKKVEIKVSQLKRVAFRSCPEHTIIIRINNDGTFVEYFNGPGEIIWQTFSGKKLPKNGQYQISLNKVLELYERIPLSKRIPKNT